MIRVNLYHMIPYKIMIYGRKFLIWMNRMNLIEFLYDTNEGERIKFHSFILIARRFEDNFYEENNENEIEHEINEEDEEDQTFEYKFYNGSNELVKIFNQKCVICLEK